MQKDLIYIKYEGTGKKGNSVIMRMFAEKNKQRKMKGGRSLS